MTIISIENIDSKIIETTLKTSLNKFTKHIIAYALLIILSCVLFLLKLTANETFSSILLVIDFFALLLLYDTLRDMLSIYNGLKNQKLIKKYDGKLTLKKEKAPTYFINNKELPKLKASDKAELKHHLDKNLELYFINNRLIFINL
ncbi:MAG: hypothetical protein ACRC28_06345 [Clostridium sp.]|uniref:hypothetical protein n=1 Tax=Clostridium sp. TaxID=1506 RepID=UPI003F3D7AA4